MHTSYFSCSFSLTLIVFFAIFQTRLSKILSLKKDWINQLKDLNTQAEKSVSCFVFIAAVSVIGYFNYQHILKTRVKDTIHVQMMCVCVLRAYQARVVL